MPEIKFEYECEACKGTGLYVGMAEGSGAAVVCNGCEGTGKAVFHMKYQEFKGRKERKGVKRVFRANVGIGIGEGKGLKLADFGGLPYEDWKDGKPFALGTEMRAFVCPAWWYQTVDYSKKPDWEECSWGSTFSSCPSFKNKSKCWERFDKEKKRNA